MQSENKRKHASKDENSEDNAPLKAAKTEKLPSDDDIVGALPAILKTLQQTHPDG